MEARTKSFLRRLGGSDTVVIRLVVINVVIFCAMALLVPSRFLTSDNILSMASQFPEVGLITLGVAITMLTSGTDLSIIAVANLSATVNAFLLLALPAGAPNEQVIGQILLCVLVSTVIGVLCGTINGYLIGYLEIPPILATLGTMNLFAGISMILTKGQGIFGVFPDQLVYLGSGLLFGVLPISTLVFFVFFIAVYIIIHKTAFGMKAQWIGSNRKVTYYSGIKNASIIFRTYMLSSVIGALTGILILARTNSAKHDYGTTYVFQGILASVLAGISPLGGKGRISNIILAIIALQLLDSGFNFLRISSFIRSSTYGMLLIVGIFIDYLLEKGNQRRMLRRAQSIK